VTAVVIGPCSIPPDEWFFDLLGAPGRIATAHGKTLAAMTAVVARFNAISETLSTAPGQHAPIFEKTEDGLALPHPWCMGFLSAMQLRLEDWQPLLDPSRPDHALMLPILLYCVDALGGPMFEPPGERHGDARIHTRRLSRHSDRHPRNSRVLDAAARRRGAPSSLNRCGTVASVTTGPRHR
jgi:yecA family protein